MDLVAGVRKEGSRGGRGEFKWTDVQSSQHRENYLGHSVMAPVGRWQKGRDLQWYARDDAATSRDEVEIARQQRHEEIQEIKRAENEALSKALGYTINFGQTHKASDTATGSNSLIVGSSNRKPRYDAGERPIGDGARRSRREPSPKSDRHSRRPSRNRERHDRRRESREDRECHSQHDRDHERKGRRSRSPYHSQRHRRRHRRSRSPPPQDPLGESEISFMQDMINQSTFTHQYIDNNKTCRGWNWSQSYRNEQISRSFRDFAA